MSDGIKVNSHNFGFCHRFAAGETCIGCGDPENGARLPEAAESPAPPVREPKDDNRCAVCGWPLDRVPDALGTKVGVSMCLRGNCSMRPFPTYAYDAERANREYGLPGKFAEAPVSEVERLREALRKVRGMSTFVPDSQYYDTALEQSARQLIEIGSVAADALKES